MKVSEAIARIKDHMSVHRIYEERAVKITEALNMAIDALKAQARQASCEYCHEDTNGYIRPLEKNGHAFIHYGIDGWCIGLSARGWLGKVKINYCPMCGRRLNK